MKKYLIVVLAMAAAMVACGGDDTTTSNDVVIAGDTAKADVKAEGIVVSDVVKAETTPVEVKQDVAQEAAGCQLCKTIYDCLGLCAQGTAGQACQQACVNGLCATDQQEFQTFYNCMDTNACLTKTTDAEVNTCVFQFCQDPYFKCFSGTQYATCVDLNACLNSCPADDPNTADVNEAQVCYSDCFTNATYEANTAFQAQYDCLYAQCPICKTATTGSPEETQCNTCANPVIASGGACATQFAACRAHGSKNCADTWTCLLAAQDSAGAQACYAAGTLTAQDLAQAWVDCALAKCTDGTLTCIDATKTADCKTQWDTCAADTATN